MNTIKTVTLFLMLLGFSHISLTQNQLEKAFDKLIGKTWLAKGNWENGTIFKQEITFKYTLEKTLVETNSKGFIDNKQTKYGNRNHGIRQYDAKTKSINFWEFDVFGKVTKGKVAFNDKNLIYTYQYGDSTITDMWQYVNDSTYNFTVGNFKNGNWQQKYLETQFFTSSR